MCLPLVVTVTVTTLGPPAWETIIPSTITIYKSARTVGSFPQTTSTTPWPLSVAIKPIGDFNDSSISKFTTSGSSSGLFPGPLSPSFPSPLPEKYLT